MEVGKIKHDVILGGCYEGKKACMCRLLAKQSRFHEVAARSKMQRILQRNEIIDRSGLVYALRGVVNPSPRGLTSWLLFSVMRQPV